MDAPGHDALHALDALEALAQERAAWPADPERASQQATEAAMVATAELVDVLLTDPGLLGRVAERVARGRTVFEALPREITASHQLWVAKGAYGRARWPSQRASPHLPSVVGAVVARRLDDARLELARRETGFPCDCRALLKLGLYYDRFPRSDRLETVRPHDDGHVSGEVRRCGHCDTRWFYYGRHDNLGTPACEPHQDEPQEVPFSSG